ncbi:hypothetical protein [Pararoseomonas indoligenes]|uniref:hypothetical protein n=1 Tax=Roseomonas indoligenes TaxID=2820811 RepID=UPI0038D07593
MQGSDRLTGGQGADLFVIEGGLLAGVETITGLQVGAVHLLGVSGVSDWNTLMG